jgi:hypothetical protein
MGELYPAEIKLIVHCTIRANAIKKLCHQRCLALRSNPVRPVKNLIRKPLGGITHPEGWQPSGGSLFPYLISIIFLVST